MCPAEIGTGEHIDRDAGVIYRIRNVLQILFYPSWNILEFYFFITVRTLRGDVCNLMREIL